MSMREDTALAEPESSAATQIQFETYYTLQDPANSNYLSWESGPAFKADKAIIYPTAKDLWFSAPAGTSSGPILTGAPVYVKISVTVHLWLAIPAPGGAYAQWANLGGTDLDYEWQLFVDENLTPGLPIDVGSSLYIVSLASPGNYLQLTPGSSYVTIGSTPAAWTVQPEGG
jgi:hypothetical protein